jgi:hypothetical protein
VSGEQSWLPFLRRDLAKGCMPHSVKFFSFRAVAAVPSSVKFSLLPRRDLAKGCMPHCPSRRWPFLLDNNAD